jgi:uncharacterized protein (TIGR02117 family)
MKIFRITGIWGALRAIFGWPLFLIGLYFLTALIGSNIPVNNAWQQPKDGIDIFVETNGVHVSIIVPISIAGEDLSDLIRPEHLSQKELYGTHAMIGWGHGGVYRNAKTWADVKSGDVASAFFGSDDTLLHIYHLINPKPAPYRKKIKVSVKQYRSIISQIRGTFLLNGNGQSIANPAYGPNNLFYNANGRYTAFNTCNSWSGHILKNAGIRTGIWTPMAGGLMQWF